MSSLSALVPGGGKQWFRFLPKCSALVRGPRWGPSYKTLDSETFHLGPQGLESQGLPSAQQVQGGLQRGVGKEGARGLLMGGGATRT